jgi:hypothetical protein
LLWIYGSGDPTLNLSKSILCPGCLKYTAITANRKIDRRGEEGKNCVLEEFKVMKEKLKKKMLVELLNFQQGHSFRHWILREEKKNGAFSHT